MEKQLEFKGTGKTTKIADKGLKKSRADLTKRLKSAGISTKIKPTKIEYFAEYSRINPTHKLEDGMESFAIRNSEGWNKLDETARNHADLRQYTPQYTITEFVELTAEQKRILERKY